MRRSTRASAPLFVITVYYLVFLVGFSTFTAYYPEFEEYLPVGGISELLERGGASFEPVEIIRTAIVQAPHMARLALAVRMIVPGLAGRAAGNRADIRCGHLGKILDVQAALPIASEQTIDHAAANLEPFHQRIEFAPLVVDADMDDPPPGCLRPS